MSLMKPARPPVKISKRRFYALGGFSNPDLFRRQVGNAWKYYTI